MQMLKPSNQPLAILLAIPFGASIGFAGGYLYLSKWIPWVALIGVLFIGSMLLGTSMDRRPTQGKAFAHTLVNLTWRISIASLVLSACAYFFIRQPFQGM
jgi:hypothetical protein